MKLFILLLTMTFGLQFKGHADPGVNDIPQEIKASLCQSFQKAEVIDWSYFQGIYKVSFIYYGERVQAFFDRDGQLKATSRYMLSTQLPIKLASELKNNYGAYWISDLFEFSSDEGTSYYVTLNSADTRIVLKSTENGWSVYKKTRLDV